MAYAKIDSGKLRELDDRSEAAVHLGNEPGSKAYRLYNPTSKRIIVSRDVVFNEKAHWNWKGGSKQVQTEPGMFHMTWENTEDNGSDPFVVGASNEEEVTEPVAQPNKTEETEDVVIEPEADEQEPIQEVRRSSRQVKKPGYLENYILLAEAECEVLLLALNDEPGSIQEALKNKKWKVACLDDIESIVKNETWTLVAKPHGVQVI